MKKFVFAVLLFILGAMPVIADDIDLPASGDLWDNWGSSQSFYGQDKPAVSDEEFDKALQSVKDKKNKLGNWLKKRQIPRGQEYSQGNETEIIEQEKEVIETLPVICLPVELSVDGNVLPVGHYQVKGEQKDNGDTILNLYQAQYLMAQIPATATSDDFGEETITFVKWIPLGDERIKIMYGSLDFNAYAVIDLK